MNDKKIICKDLYKLGLIQGLQDALWCNEDTRLEYSRKYYLDTKEITDDYGLTYDTDLEEYRERADEEEYYLYDKMGSYLQRITREYLEEQLL